MVLTRRKPHPSEALIPVATARPQVAAPAVRPEPGISAEVLVDLRAADAYSTSLAAARALLAVPLRDPAADPLPIAALLARAQHVMRSRDLAFEAVCADDREARAERSVSLAADVRADAAAGAELAELAAVIAESVPAVLAAGTGLTADVLGLALSELDELLDEPLPGSNWAANLSAVLPAKAGA